MFWNNYQDETSITAIYKQDTDEQGLVYASLALCGEVAELYQAIASLRVIHGEIQLDQDAINEVTSELGDCLWYQARIMKHLRFKLDFITDVKYSFDASVNMLVAQLMCQAGLMANKVKKVLRGDFELHPIYNEDRISPFVADRVEDMRFIFYLSKKIASKLGVAPLEEVAKKNLEKLAKRASNGTIHDNFKRKE